MASNPSAGTPMFLVHDVTNWAPERPEMLGSKEKLWLLPPQDSGLPAVPHLFKIGRPNTGENCPALTTIWPDEVKLTELFQNASFRLAQILPLAT